MQNPGRGPETRARSPALHSQLAIRQAADLSAIVLAPFVWGNSRGRLLNGKGERAYLADSNAELDVVVRVVIKATSVDETG